MLQYRRAVTSGEEAVMPPQAVLKETPLLINKIIAEKLSPVFGFQRQG